jgi:small-conductance mechanosensitive channel/CRP-like cAMP-binding protein
MRMAIMTELPLVLATALLLLALVVPRVFPGCRLWVRLVWHIVGFAALTLLAQQILGSPLQPDFDTADAGKHFWQQVIEAGWWVMGARLIVGGARLLIVLEARPRETQIVSDLLAGVVYVATALAVINFAFAVPIGGLLATSGVIAIVLGLALQSTLSDVFSGIAVDLEKPYQVGDLLWVEGGIEGRVTQVNWRSTHIATFQSNIAVVPNSVIAKARLVNRSQPTPKRGESIEVRLDPNADPEHCIAALTAATLACRMPLRVPAPNVSFTGLLGDAAVYGIAFSVSSGSEIETARTELFTRIHRHLRYDGIALALTGCATPPRISRPTPAQILEQSDLFGGIEAALRDLLAQHFTVIRFETGETAMQQGETPKALFVIASGTIEIATKGPTGTRVEYRMSPGETLGAIGLITGRAFGSVATALTPVMAYRLDGEDISAAIKVTPELKVGLEVLAQRGLAALRGDASDEETAQLARPDLFLTRLRSFLHLLGG